MSEQRLPRAGDVIELSIDTLAFGGEGVGKIKIEKSETAEKARSFTIFVEDTVPGDTVKIQVVRKKRNWARGFVKEMVKPSPLRIQPRCRHFGSPFENGQLNRIKGCGGCAWQFLSYEQQLKIKEQQVRDAIQRLGGIKKDVVLPIIGCENPWFYRNKMELSFGRTPENTLALGLHLKRRHHDLTELTECFLLGDYVGDLVSGVRKFFRGLDEKRKIDPGLVLQSFTVREGKNTGDIMVILTIESVESFADVQAESLVFRDDLKKWLDDFFASHQKKLTSFSLVHIWNKTGQAKKITEHLVAGQAFIHEELRLPSGSSLKFQISPLAFFQPNTGQAEILYGKALEAAGLTGDEVVYDLFCGTGTIGLFCAQAARKVYGIELNASAIENARTNAKLNGIENVEFLVGDVGKHLPKITEKPDVMIVDPPRNGLEPGVVEKIAEFQPKRLVYVSCNPTTLARDVQLFSQKNYQLQSVQPVDMFPQTYHIENVALLKKIF